MDTPELFDLPEPVRAFLARAGYHVRVAVVARADGRPLVDLDRRRLPALLRVAMTPNEDDGPRAADAFARTPDGEVTWTPEAKAIVDAELSRAADRDTKKPR